MFCFKPKLPATVTKISSVELRVDFLVMSSEAMLSINSLGNNGIYVCVVLMFCFGQLCYFTLS